MQSLDEKRLEFMEIRFSKLYINVKLTSSTYPHHIVTCNAPQRKKAW